MRKRALAPFAASAIAAFSLFATLELAVVSGASAEQAEVESSERSANLVVDVPDLPQPLRPTSVVISERRAVASMDMLMVSQMVEQVEKARTPKGARKIAQGIAKEKYGWGSYQFSCLNTLWTKESHWNYRARNPRTGAHGIPQALPAAKMDVISTDWRTNPITQIRWGLHYIDVRYETPCRALAKFKRSRYY
ncbi:MAG: lytic transglycosylase domain-containing protein [Actinobacteria bacterium]|nr:lytic transglycosylase domain-containing protein [Actinomycetota bacterium]